MEQHEQIADLKGNELAMLAVMRALLAALPLPLRQAFEEELRSEVETAQVVLLGSPVGEQMLVSFEKGIQHLTATMGKPRQPDSTPRAPR